MSHNMMAQYHTKTQTTKCLYHYDIYHDATKALRRSFYPVGHEMPQRCLQIYPYQISFELTFPFSRLYKFFLKDSTLMLWKNANLLSRIRTQFFTAIFQKLSRASSPFCRYFCSSKPEI